MLHSVLSAIGLTFGTAGLIGFAILIVVVLWLALGRRSKGASDTSKPQHGQRRKSFKFKRRQKRPDRPEVIVDGSNVLYWRGDAPELNTVKDLVRRVQRQGYDPIVWFDANAGYLTADRYLNEAELAEKLSLRADQVHVTPKGTQADAGLLAMAKSLNAPVISRDRYRDYEAQHPWLRKAGRLYAGSKEAKDFGIHLPPPQG